MSTRSGTRARGGYTLMELLAVITIIGVLIAMMFPALRSSREAARRLQCCNNLKQIALALHNYESTYRVLPPGVVDEKGPIQNRPEGLQIGWIAQILPSMEQQAIYGSMNSDLSVYAPANTTVAMTRINTLICPSDPHGGLPALASPGSSYAGCHHDVEAPIDVNNHGVFYLNSRVRSFDITDGTSTTIFVGEKMDQPAGPFSWMSGTRTTLRNTGNPVNAPALPDKSTVGGFASAHPGGANFCFGDGSVRYISERVNPGIYRLLGHRDDGEMVDEKAF